MKRFLSLLLLFLLLFVVSACSPHQRRSKPAPTSSQLTTSDYGPYPDNYIELIKNKMRNHIIDPYSANFEFPEPPVKGWGRHTRNEYPVIGWRGFFFVQPKSYDGKPPTKVQYGYVIHDGRVLVLDKYKTGDFH